MRWRRGRSVRGGDDPNTPCGACVAKKTSEPELYKPEHLYDQWCADGQPSTGIDPAEYACGTPIAHTHDVCLNNFATAPENTMKYWNEGLDWAKKASEPDEEEWRRIKMQCEHGEGMKWEEVPGNRSDPLLFRNNCKEHEGTTVYLEAPSEDDLWIEYRSKHACLSFGAWVSPCDDRELKLEE